MTDRINEFLERHGLSRMAYYEQHDHLLKRFMEAIMDELEIDVEEIPQSNGDRLREYAAKLGVPHMVRSKESVSELKIKQMEAEIAALQSQLAAIQNSWVRHGLHY